MARSSEDFDDMLEERASRKVRSYTRRKIKRLNGFTLFFCILALVAGVVIGVFAYKTVCADDVFRVKGEKEYAIKLNSADFVYIDEGVEVIEFGKDISDVVAIETNMEILGDGRYTVDTSVPARYYIKYTVDSTKYAEVCRIRTFVIGGED